MQGYSAINLIELHGHRDFYLCTHLHNAPVPLAGDATALAWRAAKIAITQ